MRKTPFKTPLVTLCSAALLLGVAGCNQDRTDDTPTDAGSEAAAPAVPPMPTDDASMMASADALVLTVSSAGAEAPYLTDASGNALYLLEGDQDGSQCTDACLQAWPPMPVSGSDEPANVGPRLHADMVGSIERADGTRQLTYNGHPLYRYSADDGAGSIAGQDLTDEWGEWYLVTPEGIPLELEDEQP